MGIVSPGFELCSGKDPLEFKMVIRAADHRNEADRKKYLSFKEADGRGIVELKCESNLEDVSPQHTAYRFQITVGKGADSMTSSRTHDFAQDAVSLSPDDDWDLSAAVDKATSTFVVNLQIAATSSTAGRDLTEVVPC